jgi:PBP1b-binding outer membrane lipoprotein LpoB
MDVAVMKRFAVLVALIFVTAGCAGAGPSSQSAKSQLPSVTQTPHPQYQTIDILSVSGIENTSLSDFFPQIITVTIYNQNTTLVPVRANPNSFENEIPILDQTFASTAITNIESKDSYVYMEPTSPSNVWIEFSIYKFKDSITAQKAIDLYSTRWNLLELVYDNGSIWVWEGWKEQVTTGRIPDRYKTGAFCSWDPTNRVLVFADQGITAQVLTSPKADLFCFHGEQARGPYFFMIDLHASPAVIDEVGREAFAQLVPHIFNVTINESLPEVSGVVVANVTGNVTGNTTVIIVSETDKEIRELEDQIIELTRRYTQNEITYEEFSRIFEIYDGRIKELKGE